MSRNLNAAPDTALILSGGGARAAYQVGALLAIAKLLPQHAPNPFPIICGTSAGAINAAGLAMGAGEFRRSVFSLARMWQNLQQEQVYHGSLGTLMATGAHWLAAMLLGGLGKKNPRSFLDNAPLRDFLGQIVDFSQIQRNIDSGALKAVSISALGYSSGQSVAFFQAAEGLQSWQRASRIGVRTQLEINHLMASSAIPLVFPAERIHREYFGDGSVRQIAPLSPAIHLGAKRMLVIGVAPQSEVGPARQHSTAYPTLAQVSGQLMNSIFLDAMELDLERMTRINRTISFIPDEVRQSGQLNLRPVEVLTIAPSQPLEKLSLPFRREFSLGMRFFLGGLGAFRRQGSVLASYLLFCGPYARRLIALGYHDALQKEQLLRDFLAADQSNSALE